MKIKLLTIGKTKSDFLKIGIELFKNRLEYYIPFEYIELKDVKKGKQEQVKEEEAELILKRLEHNESLILLDEKGKNFNSEEFAQFLQTKMNSGLKSVCFVVGGAYGFSNALYNKADGKIALSKMTFTHEMARLFFVEQTYRAMTILKGEKYHH